MSTFEDYQSASKVYDRARRAVGLEFYIGALVRHVTNGQGLQQVRVLDAGCGTGNYSAALLAAGCGAVSACDGSEGMLAVARAKLARWVETGRADLQQALLPRLPYEDSSFDAVMCNQVIHHLTTATDKEGSFPAVGELVRSIERVLKPGGVALINYTMPHQNDSYWFITLLPTAKRILMRRQPTLQQIKELLHGTSLSVLEVDVPVHSTLISPDLYHQYRSGAADEEFRRLDSTWSLASEEEVQAAQDAAQCLDDKQIAEWERYRLTYGQCTTLLLQKASP